MNFQFEKATFIEKKLREQLNNKLVSNNFITQFSDASYYLPTLEELNIYLHNNPIKLKNRDPLRGTEGFDCDDFSYALKGQITLYNRNVTGKPHSWAVGIAWGFFSWIKEKHACNWVMLRDRSLYLIEPQNNRLFLLKDSTLDLQLILL